MTRTKKLELLAVTMACVLVAFLAAPTQAQKPFLEKIRKHYTLDKSNGQCTLCHEVKVKEEPTRKNLNAFGKAIQADPTMKPLLGKEGDYKFTAKDLEILEKVVVKLENIDSDGDGATNREELDLGTLPGDPKSVPSKSDLAKYRKDHPPAAAAAATPSKSMK